jgi:hypothetical protein
MVKRVKMDCSRLATQGYVPIAVAVTSADVRRKWRV